MDKTCSKCGMTKPASDFRPQKRHCKDCVAAYAAEWYQRNVEKVRVRRVQWRVSNRNKWNAMNIAWRQRNPESSRNASSRWAKQNPSAAWEKVSRRRAAKARAIPKWADWRAMRAVYEAARERSKETGQRWTVDHVVPLRSPVVCGLHCEANLAIVTLQENSAKGNRFWPDMPSP